jgi:U3 small nucleolar RNA-associated protein 14
MILQPINTLARPQSDASSATLNSTDLLSPPPASPLPAMRPGLSAPAASQELNPWLIHDVRTTAKAPTKYAIVVGKDSNALNKAKHKLKKQVGKGGKEREKAKDDAIVEILTNNVLLLPPTATVSLTSKTATVKLNGCAAEEDGSDFDSEIEMALLKGTKGSDGLKVFGQKDLAALAFPGDNVVQVCTGLYENHFARLTFLEL